jgi:hypothetical protein
MFDQDRVVPLLEEVVTTTAEDSDVLQGRLGRSDPVARAPNGG